MGTISKNKLDIAIFAISLGILTIHAILFIIYLILRQIRQSNSKAWKADRPLWVAMIVSSGAFWILSSLQLYGVAEFIPTTRYSCVCLKFILQYTIGFILWVSAVLYRMIRLYMTFTIVSARPLHAAACVALLLAPFVVLSLVAIGVNDMGRGAKGMTCMQSQLWNGLLFGMSFIYTALYLFFFLRLLAIIGALKGLKKYILMTGASFVFVLYDAILHIRHLYYAVHRRMMMLIVLFFVAMQTWTVFGYILVRPIRKTRKSEGEDDQSVDQKRLLLIEEANPLPPKIDLYIIQERAKRRHLKRGKAKDTASQTLENIMSFFKGCVEVREEIEPDDEIDERVPHYAVPDDFIIYTPASTDPTVGRKCEFVNFIKALHPEDKSRLEPKQGIYRVGNMYCTVEPMDLDICLKYLGEPVDLVSKVNSNDDDTTPA